jgi:methylthioribulose-1-phosphate dehydratase
MSDFTPTQFAECASAIADAGRDFALRGWTPATSSNFSMRLTESRIAVTVSGRDKGKLTPADVMVCDLAGHAVDTDARPSAETLLHCQIYRRYPAAGAVLHTHSLAQTLASRLWAPAGHLTLAGYELLKAFAGYTTHDAQMQVQVFPNSQDMNELARLIDVHLDQHPNTHGYLIDGHGIYTWGRDMLEARRHLDAFEFLLNCELELRKMQR